jgi:hypothetical protein
VSPPPLLSLPARARASAFLLPLSPFFPGVPAPPISPAIFSSSGPLARRQWPYLTRRPPLGFTLSRFGAPPPNPSRQSCLPPPRAPGRRRPASSPTAAVIRASETRLGGVRKLLDPSFPPVSPYRRRARSPEYPSRTPPSPGRYGHLLRPLCLQSASPCSSPAPRPDPVIPWPRKRPFARRR